MFNRLKSQITEKAGADSIVVVTNGRKQFNKESKSFDKYKSNQSDGTLSSDDTSSIKSAKIILEDIRENSVSTNTTNNKNDQILISSKNITTQSSIEKLNNHTNGKHEQKDSDDQTNQENSIKSQLQQLNQSLLNQIDVLTVGFLNYMRIDFEIYLIY